MSEYEGFEGPDGEETPPPPPPPPSGGLSNVQKGIAIAAVALLIGGIGGVSTHPDARRKGYASVALNAAVQTLRDRQDAQFGLLFCEPHNAPFYRARNWQAFTGEVYVEQPEGRVLFTAMAPFVFDLKRAPRRGTIDLCGLPW